MQDPTHGFRLSDFTEEDIDHLAYVIIESATKNNPMDWMGGYIEGSLTANAVHSDSVSNFIMLMDIFWSYLWQGGHEHTSPGHIGLGPYSTTDCAKELIKHYLDSEKFDVDILLDYISDNMRKR